MSLNGHPEKRLPQNLSLSFDDVAGEDLQREATKYISASAGSACLSAGQSKSHVLEAIGLSNKKAQTTLRISVGKDTTESDIENAAKGLKNVVMSLRGAAAANLQAAKN